MRDAFAWAWPALKRRFGLFLIAQLIMFAAWIALEVAVIAGQRLGFGIAWWIVAHLAFLFFFAGMQLGLLRICLALRDGATPTLGDALVLLADGPRFFAAELVYAWMVLAGSALLLLPGLYLAARYAFVGFAMAEGKPGLLSSFQQSAALTRGMWGRVLALLFVLLVLNVLGACLLGLGLFVTVPLSLLALAAGYRQLGG